VKGANGVEGGGRRRPSAVPLIVVGGIVAATLMARKRGYMVGGNVVVRCRRGHLFTTLWIPGVKMKSIDLGVARIQRCPVGKHWSLVVPVREADLSQDESRRAHEVHDIGIP
jgi:hypothetical protein